MKDYLKIHRDRDRENTLKALIEEIEALLDTANDELVVEKLAKANYEDNWGNYVTTGKED